MGWCSIVVFFPHPTARGPRKNVTVLCTLQGGSGPRGSGVEAG
jgi:hypothetical protein